MSFWVYFELYGGGGEVSEYQLYGGGSEEFKL